MDDNAAAGPFTVAGMQGLDSADACRLRLVTLQTRIFQNWPKQGGVFRRRPQAADDALARLLEALPSPLPIQSGGRPVPIMDPIDTDLRAAAARAVDAAMVLLEKDSLDVVYPGRVHMLAGIGSEVPAVAGVSPVELDQPTVGLLVATIIGTLEAVSERLTRSPGGRHVRRS